MTVATPPTPARRFCVPEARMTPTLSKPSAKSSFILTPTKDGWDDVNIATFPETETPVGSIAIVAQFQQYSKRISAKVNLRRDPEDQHTKSSRLPVRCTLTLSVTDQNAREYTMTTQPQAFAMDKDQPIATYLALIPLGTLLSTIVYEAQVVLAALSWTESFFPRLYLATIDDPHASDCILLAKNDPDTMHDHPSLCPRTF